MNAVKSLFTWREGNVPWRATLLGGSKDSPPLAKEGYLTWKEQSPGLW